MRGEMIVRRLTGAHIRRRLRRHLYSIDGLHHLPESGPFVLVPNHRSYFDHFVIELLVGATVNRPVWFLTKQESFSTFISRLWTSAWYGIPVDRDKPTPETLRAVQRVFSSGEVLCVYPEGTRNASDQMLPFQAGAFRFALSAEVPIIPVAMIGSETVLPKGQRRFRPEGQVHVAFGEPILPPKGKGKQRAAQELATAAEAAIRDLLLVADRNARDPQKSALIERVAGHTDDLITKALSPEGWITREDLRRLSFVVSLLRRMETSPHHLEVQRIRLHALAISRLPAALRLLPALTVRRRLARILARDPGHSMANYLVARWCLAMPTALGGGRHRAEAAFAESARFSEQYDTRAVAGLAAIQLAEGRLDEARASLERIARAPVRPGSRDETRVERARKELERLRASERTAGMTA